MLAIVLFSALHSTNIKTIYIYKYLKKQLKQLMIFKSIQLARQAFLETNAQYVERWADAIEYFFSFVCRNVSNNASVLVYFPIPKDSKRDK